MYSECSPTSHNYNNYLNSIYPPISHGINSMCFLWSKCYASVLNTPYTITRITSRTHQSRHKVVVIVDTPSSLIVCPMLQMCFIKGWVDEIEKRQKRCDQMQFMRVNIVAPCSFLVMEPSFRTDQKWQMRQTKVDRGSTCRPPIYLCLSNQIYKCNYNKSTEYLLIRSDTGNLLSLM